MSKVYAICTLDGLIRLTEQQPTDGHFALAVGDLAVVRQVIRETAEPTPAPRGSIASRVPGAAEGADPRANLGAIARYIHALSERDVPGFRPLGV